MLRTGLLGQRIWDHCRSCEEPDDILIRGSEAVAVSVGSGIGSNSGFRIELG